MAGGGGGAQTGAEDAGPRRNAFGETIPQSVELNLTALMDILSNLLFFLLASFGATIVMSINGTVPVQTSDQSDVPDNKQTVTVNVRLTKDAIDLTAAGTGLSDAELDALKKVLPHVGGRPDSAGLAAHLKRIKEAHPKSDTLLLTPEAGVNYAAMIEVMDASREMQGSAPGQPPQKLFPTVVVSTVVK